MHGKTKIKKVKNEYNNYKGQGKCFNPRNEEMTMAILMKMLVYGILH